MTKSVVVVGSVVVDEIFTLRGEHYVSFGGITYTLVALAKLLPRYQILPITYIGERKKEKFIDFLSKFQNINLEGIKISKSSNTNTLMYVDTGSRVERFKKSTPGLSFMDVYPFLDNADAVYVNYIKDDDFSVQDLRSLSSFLREGVIYIDIHSLVRKVDKNGLFLPRYFQGWQSIVQYADFVQLNEEEAHFFTGFEFETIDDLKNLVAMILMSGPRGVSVTLGERGVLAGERNKGKVRTEGIPAEKVDARDPTGCGDVYGAAVLKEILDGEDFINAARYGVKVASIKAQMPLEEFVTYPIN